MNHMFRMGALACALLVSGSLRAADNQLTAKEKTAGWRILFDGKTYANWEDPTKKSPAGDSFTIDGGCLRSSPHARIVEDLFTKETFTDFELDFDWKISAGGNSGIKYRIQDRAFLIDEAGSKRKFEDRAKESFRNKRTDRPAKGQEYVVGYEYQILDNASNPDALNGATHQTGALYDMFPPAKDMARPVGQWNHSRLLVKGDHVEHWLNGEKVVDGSLNAPEVAKGTGARWGVGSPVYDLLVKHPRKACQISLQNHNSDAWFKNIKIRVL